MRTTVSIPDSLSNAAESLEHRLGISRSNLYGEALEACISTHDDRKVLEMLDEVYSNQSSELCSALAQLQLSS